MDSVPQTGPNDGSVFVAHKDVEAYALAVDPFLVEALQNPRHRLTILRMELDIQKFLQNSEQQQFEFQHFPTSYLRLAAHRVAQHYGLQTLVQDNILDGLGTKIVVKKLPESRYPAVRLSEVPAKHTEDGKHEQIKIVMRPRHNKASLNGESETGLKQSSLRTVEERKEEYDRARARIFSSPELEESMYQAPLDGKNICINGEENEASRNYMFELEKSLSARDGCTSSRVAILRDREKDRIDPDYDRSYVRCLVRERRERERGQDRGRERNLKIDRSRVLVLQNRYVKNVPANQSFSLVPFDMQKFQTPFVQYDTGFPHLGQMPRTQASLSHRTPIMGPLCSTGFNQTSRDAVYMQWPTSAMMYAQSYEQFRHAVFQVPYIQQPLSFDYSQNR